MPACSGRPSRFARTSATEPGTRGLRNPAEALADAKRQLDDLKGATPRRPRRRSSTRPIELLPTLDGNAEGAGRVRAPGAVARRRLGRSTRPRDCRRSGSARDRRCWRGSAAPADGTRGIGDVVRHDRRRRRQFLNLTTLVCDEGTIRHGRRQRAWRRRARALRDAQPAMRIHLVGHSLGGRLMAACAKALGASRRRCSPIR